MIQLSMTNTCVACLKFFFLKLLYPKSIVPLLEQILQTLQNWGILLQVLGTPLQTLGELQILGTPVQTLGTLVQNLKDIRHCKIHFKRAEVDPTPILEVGPCALR